MTISSMNSVKNLSVAGEGIISINGPSDVNYWCSRLQLSPFALFHILRTVGSCLTDVVDFLHREQVVGDSMQKRRSNKDFTIL
jgi:hypothetical protein